MSEGFCEIPFAMLAELTHACPLACLYCSNPLELTKSVNELSTQEWLSIIEQAAALGVVQVHFSGGEPLLRKDLPLLVQRARELDLYVNLITSGIGLTSERAKELKSAGVDCIQLSIQDSQAERAREVANVDVHERKLAVAKLIRDAGIPLHLNVVLHRLNIDHLSEIIDLGIACGAERIELANSQYYGWALLNRHHLLPSSEQMGQAQSVFERAKDRLAGQTELIWVLSDYHEDLPKPCMSGWGRVNFTVAPDGRVLPCPAASAISALRFDNAREQTLSAIWHQSEAFNAFRGVSWMQEPCRSCDLRFQDFGGCRCQAFALTGDAARTDPVCRYAPDRQIVDKVVALANGEESVYTEGAQQHGYTYRQF